MDKLKLYNFMNERMPAKAALVLTTIGYALLLVLFIVGYKYLNADLRYAGM